MVAVILLLLVGSNIALWGAVLHMVRGGNRVALDLMSTLVTGEKAPGAGDYRIPYVLYTVAAGFLVAAIITAVR